MHFIYLGINITVKNGVFTRNVSEKPLSEIDVTTTITDNITEPTWFLGCCEKKMMRSKVTSTTTTRVEWTGQPRVVRAGRIDTSQRRPPLLLQAAVSTSRIMPQQAQEMVAVGAKSERRHALGSETWSIGRARPTMLPMRGTISTSSREGRRRIRLMEAHGRVSLIRQRRGRWCLRPLQTQTTRSM